MKKSFLLLLASLFSFVAVADYEKCVLGKLKASRKADVCNFMNVQTQVRSANKDCSAELSALLQNVSSDPDQVRSMNMKIAQIKVSTDLASEQLLKDEILKCGYSGDVSVNKSGLSVSLSLMQN